LIANEKTREIDMVRLVMLYALRYEKHSNNDVCGLVDALARRGVTEKYRKVSDGYRVRDACRSVPWFRPVPLVMQRNLDWVIHYKRIAHYCFVSRNNVLEIFEKFVCY
jgi:hypothetical protein